MRKENNDLRSKLEAIKALKTEHYIGTSEAYALLVNRDLASLVAKRTAKNINDVLQERYGRAIRYPATEENVLYLLTLYDFLVIAFESPSSLSFEKEFGWLDHYFSYNIFFDEIIFPPIKSREFRSPKFDAQKSVEICTRAFLPCYIHLVEHDKEYPKEQKFLFWGFFDLLKRFTEDELRKYNHPKFLPFPPRMEIQVKYEHPKWDRLVWDRLVDALFSDLPQIGLDDYTLRNVLRHSLHEYLEGPYFYRENESYYITLPSRKVSHIMPDPKTVAERIIRRDLDFWEMKKRIRNLHEGFGTFLKIHALNEISSTIHYLLTFAYYGRVCPAFILGPGLLLTYDEIESSWGRTVCSMYLPRFTIADLLKRIIERMRRDGVCDRFDLRRSFLSEFIVQHDLAAESYEEIIELVERQIAYYEKQSKESIQIIEQWKQWSPKLDYNPYREVLQFFRGRLQYFETVKEFLRSEKNWVKRVQEQGR